ncbi:hypothetical protein AMECASPLE_001555 [Ameca splendens]|uniref:Uncharacterized protein n=1 Tax=Ameca splendens TaxID=208324 RepID=A0ABV0ZUW4_9TELE
MCTCEVILDCLTPKPMVKIFLEFTTYDKSNLRSLKYLPLLRSLRRGLYKKSAGSDQISVKSLNIREPVFTQREEIKCRSPTGLCSFLQCWFLSSSQPAIVNRMKAVEQ